MSLLGGVLFPVHSARLWFLYQLVMHRNTAQSLEKSLQHDMRLLLTASACCMRSALFPIPLAFESTGIIAALIAMIVVALATIYTVELLMAQSIATGMHDYSTLSLAVGGWWYKVAVFLVWGLHACPL